MKEIIDVLKIRFSSPVLGYYTFFLFYINWKAFFFLIFTKDHVEQRIAYFSENTNWQSIFLFPIIISIIFSILHPWISYIIEFLNSKPYELRNSLLLSVENKILIKKQENEQHRARLLREIEESLIESAIRDEKIENKISSNEIKNELKTKINEMRNEIGNTSNESKEIDFYKKHSDLINIANEYRKRANEASTSFDRDNFFETAREIEEKAKKILNSI